MYMDDTIAAISTAVNESGIGIVRISGPDAMRVGDCVFRAKKNGFSLSSALSHTIHYGFVMDGEDVIDEVLVSVMRAPRTFTAEDTVEINCHGGVYAMQRVLEAVLKHGARAAEPGEFTKRAFLNGRIDLSQAEAVMDVIQAKNAYALNSSVSQLKGSVRDQIRELRGEIIHETARIEAALDDPEHYSLDGYGDQLLDMVDAWQMRIQRFLDTADQGRMIREGIKTVIVGRPNAGKSSLLNALLGEERAIVTEIEGTTRDTLTETIRLGDLVLNLCDTAGIHNTEDFVEKIGVDRAIKGIEEADLVLYLADSSEELNEDDEKILSLLEGSKWIALLNKSDLSAKTDKEGLTHFIEDIQNKGIQIDLPEMIEISAKHETGLENLTACIQKLFFSGKIKFNDQVIITNVRHKNQLREAAGYLKNVKESIEMCMPEDFYSIDLTGAYTALGEITGDQCSEDLANEIFGKFCMGK